MPTRNTPAPTRTAPRAPQAPARGAGGGGGNQNASALLAKALRTAGGKWNAAKEESAKNSFGGTTLTDGQHVCKLTAMEIRSTDNGPKLVIDLTAIEGDEIGEKGQIWHDFSDEGMIHLQRTLRRMGVDVDAIEPEDLPVQLPQEIERLLAEQPGIRVNVKTKGQYTNCYIDKLVDVGVGDPDSQVDPDNSEPEEAAPAPTPRGRGRQAPPPADEPPADDVDDTAADELEPGMDVQWKKGRTVITGVVKSIDGDDVTCRRDSDKKVEVVPYGNLEILATD